MNEWLKIRTAGLPRWAWVTLFGGAVVVGLWLRSRTVEQEAEAETAGAGTPAEGSLGYYEGTSSAGGLAAAGLVGPASESLVPVQTPYIPEGFVDMFSELTGLAAELGGYITEHQNVVTENPTVTGGGAPESGGDHTVPTVAPTCPTSVISSIRKNQAEITRLQGEINALQNEIATLTNWIQAHPNAKDVSKWKATRAQDQTNIAGKRAKVSALSAANQALRAKPGCAKVAV